MGDRAAADACKNCRLLFRPGKQDDGRCPTCGAPLTRLDDAVAVIDGKLRPKKKGYAIAPRSMSRRPTEALPEYETRRDAAPLLTPERGTKPPQPISADDALGALASANVQEPPAKPRPPETAGSRPVGSDAVTQDEDSDSLFIPLDDSKPVAPAGDLFGASQASAEPLPKVEAGKRGAGKLPHPVDFGDYELLEILGRGGMGVVYMAREKKLGRLVALKLMSIRDISDEDRARFLREARSAARLQHPNIVPLFNIGSHLGHDFFTLELIEGTTLHTLALARTLDFEGSARVVAKIARAIDYAHEQGVIHRDLKPQNILMDKAQEPHVTDFGLAKDLRDDVNLTTPGIALGSPPYMPPEQAAGAYDRVDARSDVYGLGTILYECLTGSPPFIGQTVYEILARVQSEEPRAPRFLDPDVPSDLENICLRAMEKNPASRYESAKSLARDLDRFLAGDPIHARPPTLTTKIARRIVKYRFQFASFALALAAVLAMFIFVIAAVREANRAPAAPHDELSEIDTDSAGGPVDRALELAARNRLEEALVALGATFEVRPIERAPFLAAAREGADPSLAPALAMLAARTESPLLAPALLLETLGRRVAELGAEEMPAYKRGAVALLDRLIAAAWPPAASGTALKALHPGALRRGDGELARDCCGTLLEALGARAERSRGRIAEARRRMLALIERATPERALLALARAELALEGGLARPEGRAFLEHLTPILEAAKREALLEAIRDGLPAPELDLARGELRAPRADFSDLRWRFPPLPLAAERRASPALALNDERYAERLLASAGRAAFPTNPIPSLDGRQQYVGWLGTVFILDDRDGRVLRRLRVPGRIVQLRSQPGGRLLASCVRSSGAQVGRAHRDDYLIDPEDGSVRRPLPGPEERSVPLRPQERFAFDPLVAEELRIEGDGILGWGTLHDELLTLKVARARGEMSDDQLKRRSEEAVAGFTRRNAENFDRYIDRPWVSLRRAALGGDPALAKAAAELAAASPVLTPFEQVRLAIALDRLGFAPSTDELLHRALKTLLKDHGYCPELAGYGPYDPGWLLTRRLSELLEQAKAHWVKGGVKDKTIEQLTRRYRTLEGYRDAFAPALAASSHARRTGLALLPGLTAVVPNGPKPYEDGGLRPERAMLSLGMTEATVVAMALHFTTNAMLFIGVLAAALTWRNVRRRQHRDWALLGLETRRERWLAWRARPELMLEHSFPSYLTWRDRAAVAVFVLLFLFVLAFYDTAIEAFDTRDRAPRPLYSGLLGHPQSIEHLTAQRATHLSVNTAVAVDELLAFGLAQAGDREGALALYAALATRQADPSAFNACMLRELGKRLSSDERGRAADQLDGLIDMAAPERHWARWILTRDIAAQERALQRAGHRFAILDEFGGGEAVLIPPSTATRDATVLGRTRWWTAIPLRFLCYLVALRDHDILDAAARRYLASVDEVWSVAVLLSLRRHDFFLLPALLLLALAALALPTRALPKLKDENEPTRRDRLELFVPGLAQFRRGYTPSGLLLLAIFLFLTRHLIERRVIKLFDFGTIAALTGEIASAELDITIIMKAYLVAALLLVYVLHWLQLTKIRRREEQLALFGRSSRLTAEQSPNPAARVA